LKSIFEICFVEWEVAFNVGQVWKLNSVLWYHMHRKVKWVIIIPKTSTYYIY